MDFNGPGTSIFQGTDLNSFDNNAQREEEEEAMEERRRRDIELNDILQSAFNDVSFDNDDCSGVNISFNHSNSKCHSSASNAADDGAFNNLSNSDLHFMDLQAKEFHTPIRHSRSIRTKAIDFHNQHEADSFTNKFRIKQQNGNLHDIVDASGGGDAGVSLQQNHSIPSNPIVEHSSNQNILSQKTDGNLSLNKQYQNAEFNSIEQLQILYDIRVREVHKLTEVIDTMKNTHEIEKNELQRQLVLSVAEQERQKISQNNLQDLLVESKTTIDCLQKENESLKRAVNTLEENQASLQIELETSKAMATDLERKIIAIEKGRKDITAMMQYEVNINELKERHAANIKFVTHELEKTQMNLESAKKENDELKHKINQMSQANDEDLARKSEIIQRLSKKIEEMQVQCENLMKNSVTEDNMKLQMQIEILKEENSVLTSRLRSLEKNLENSEMEIKQYECLSNFSAFNVQEADDQADIKENEYSEMNKRLREELFRALNSQKARRQEIQSLQALITKKDEEIHCMAEKERTFLAEAAKFREDIGKHIMELKKYESLNSVIEEENKKLKELVESNKKDLEEKLTSALAKCEDLKEEKMLVEEELAMLEKKMVEEKIQVASKCNDEYMRFHNEGLQRVREEVKESLRLELLGKDMEIENLKKEVEEVKNLYVEVYNEKEKLLIQIEKGLSLNRNESVDVDDVKKLEKELEKSRQRILDLDLTLKQQYQQEVEQLSATIKSLNVAIEKMRREKDHETSEKTKIITENELLKSEIEQITAEKNLYFLDCEALKNEVEQLRKSLSTVRESSDYQKNNVTDEYDRHIQDLCNKYEIKIQKLNKEIDLLLTQKVSTDSKYTSPMKTSRHNLKDIAIQRSPVPVHSVSTSPLHKFSTHESCTSPIYDYKRDGKTGTGSNRDVSILTDPEPRNLSKRDVIRMMEKLGQEHEEEMNTLENRYKIELLKLNKKWQTEMSSIADRIRLEMMNRHVQELEKLQEKHKIEIENRIEQEKKEAVVALITEWACEVQGLKQTQAEIQAEMEKMRMKYKTAKNIALRYKTYFTSKAEQMKEEWRKVEEGYETALKELEKNVHMLVDVREDEVKAKVQAITKAYEHKITKMKRKLEKYEDLLRNEIKAGEGEIIKSSSKSSIDDKKNKNCSSSSNGPDKLVAPASYLCDRVRRKEAASTEPAEECRTLETVRHELRKLLVEDVVVGTSAAMDKGRVTDS